MLKKITAVFAIMLCCLALVACKDKKADQDVLMVGINAEYPPFEYYEGGNIVGIDVDLANALGKKLNKKIVFENMKFNTLLASLAANKVDVIISGLGATDERKQQFNFSDVYYDNKIVVIVKEDENSIKTIDDLKGKTIGTQVGTVSDNFVSGIEGATINRYDSTVLAIMNLKAGKDEMTVIDMAGAVQVLGPNDGFKILEDIKITGLPYAIAINKGNDELLAQINQALKEMKESGELDAIINKHMKKSIDDDKNSTTEEVSDNQDATEVVVDIENK